MRGETGCENGARLGRVDDRPYGVYLLSILIRAVHQVGAAVFLAAYLLDILPGPPITYVLIAVVSGVLLMAAEWWRHRQIFRELAGAITIAKVLLLWAAYRSFLPPAATVLFAFLIASLGAHAPKKTRHRLLY